MHTQENRLIETGGSYPMISGEMTTTVPRIDFTSEHKSLNSLRRIYGWLIENARAEALRREDSFNLRLFEALNPLQLSQADLDGLNLYLWDAGLFNLTNKRQRSCLTRLS